MRTRSPNHFSNGTLPRKKPNRHRTRFTAPIRPFYYSDSAQTPAQRATELADYQAYRRSLVGGLS